MASDGLAGSISGQASQPGINPFDFDPRVEVSLYLADGETFVDFVRTDNGGYSFDSLAAGSYKVYFSPTDEESPFEPKWWDGASTAAVATVIVVEGQPVTGINGLLRSKASISGHVTLANGADRGEAGEIDVFAYGEGGGKRSTGVGGDGTYTLAGLDPGTYRIQFYPSGPNDYQPQDFPSVITIAEGDQLIGFDAQLHSNRLSVTGVVSAADGSSPISNVNVTLFDGGRVSQRTASDSAGAYSFFGVPPGSYSLQVTDPSSTWLDQWFPGAPDRTDAQLILVLDERPVNVAPLVLQRRTPLDPVSSGPTRPDVEPGLFEDEGTTIGALTPAARLADTGAPVRECIALAGGSVAFGVIVLWLGSRRCRATI